MKKALLLWIPVILGTIITFIGTSYLYEIIPNRIPIQWSFTGDVSLTAPKIILWISIFLPSFMAVIYSLFPFIFKKVEFYKVNVRVYHIFCLFTCSIFFIIHWISILSALGHNLNIKIMIGLIVGLFFIMAGNVLPRIRSNYLLGIRTPWTLSNDIVWRKTHYFAGFSMVFTGLLLLILLFLPSKPYYLFTFIIICSQSLLTLLYSFLIYRKVKK